MKRTLSPNTAATSQSSSTSAQNTNCMQYLDIFRLVAALLVVAIHTSPLSSFNADADFFLTRVLARVAVPFFLMVTGFFVLSDIIYDKAELASAASTHRKMKKYLKKTLLLYVFSILLYFPVGLYAGHFQNFSSFSFENLWKMIKMLLFDGTFYHLWYFPACMIGMLLLLMLKRFLTARMLTAVTVILYFIGLFGDSYYGVIAFAPVLSKIYQFLFQISTYTRNGIFFAPLFLLLGAKIGAKQASKPSNDRQTLQKISQSSAQNGNELLYFGYLICFLIGSFLLMTLEAFTLHRLNLQRHDSMYFSLIPVMYFLMKSLLSLNQSHLQKTQTTMRNTACLRPITTWIYILHPLMIVVLRGLAKATHQTALFVENSLIHYIGVCILSVLVSVGIHRLRNLFTAFCADSQYGTAHKKNNNTENNIYLINTPSSTEYFPSDAHNQLTQERAWIELDMEALRQNVMFLQSQLPRNCRFMPIVKANAYGHGAVLIANALQDMGVSSYGVATLQEGIELRQHGITGELLILGYTAPAQLPLLLQYRLTQTLVDYSYATQLADIWEHLHYTEKLHVHLGIDTGMHRIGERSEHIDKIITIFQLKAFQMDGIFTHLATSDIKKKNGIIFQEAQKRAFSNVIAALEQQNFQCPPIHFLASYGTLNNTLPALKNGAISPSEKVNTTNSDYNRHLTDSIHTYGSYVRVGIALYGVLSNKQDTLQWQNCLKPVLSLKAKIVSVRPLYKNESAGYGLQFISDRNRTIATLAIGYADGLPRSLSNQKGYVLINGYKAPIIGSICMDMTIVDVTNIPDVSAGQIAVLIGKSGALESSASEIAECAGTITNDILSRLGGRLERILKE